MDDKNRERLIDGGVGVFSALTFLLVFSGNIFLTLVGQLALTPLFVLGFVRGWTAALIAAGVGSLCVGGLAGFGEMVHYALNTGIVAVLMLFLAFRHRFRVKKGSKTPIKVWYPEGYLALTLCGYYICFMAAVFFLLRDDLDRMAQTPVQDWAYFKDILALNNLTIQDLLWMGYVFSGPVMMVLTLVNAWFAGRLINRLKLPTIRTPLDLKSVRLPWSLWVLFAAMGGIFFILPDPYNKMALSGVLIAAATLSLEGFALIHRAAGRYERGPLFLWIFYGCMIVFLWPFLLVVMLGIFDPWIGLEARLKKREES